MRFEIFNEKKSQKTIRLKLVKANYPVLCVVDDKGVPVLAGNLLKFYPDGIERLLSVNPDIGLELDKEGKIVIK